MSNPKRRTLKGALKLSTTSAAFRRKSSAKTPPKSPMGDPRGQEHKANGKLIMAIKRDDWQDAKKLLAANTSTVKQLVNSIDRKLVTPLMHCVLHNSKGTIKVVLGSGADTNAQDKNGDTALHLACKLEYQHMIKLLMRFGGNPKIKNYNGELCHQRSKRSLQISRLIQQSLEQRNNPPQVAKYISDVSAHTGTPFTLEFDEETFVDADGDDLSYSAYGMPPSIVFNSQKRRFFGVPSLEDCKGYKDFGEDYLWSRKFEVTVYAADAYSMAAQTFKLTVYNTSEVQAPYVVKPLEDTSAKVGDEFVYKIPEGTFSKPDLDITVDGLPSSIKYSPELRVFRGIPTPGEAQITTVDDEEEREEERRREKNLRRIGEQARSAKLKAEMAAMDQEALTATAIYLQRWYRGYIQRRRLRELISLAHMHLKGVMDYVYTVSVVGSVPNEDHQACSTTFDIRVFWEDAKSEAARKEKEAKEEAEKLSKMTAKQKKKMEQEAADEKARQKQRTRIDKKRLEAAAAKKKEKEAEQAAKEAKVKSSHEKKGKKPAMEPAKPKPTVTVKTSSGEKKTMEMTEAEMDAPECENCENANSDVYCAECDMHLCYTNNCDDDFHKPKKMRTHRRTFLREKGLQANAKKTATYERYHTDEGAKIIRYECEDDAGFYYVYKNHSSICQLEEILEFSNLNNLVLEGDGLEGQSKIRVFVPPGGSAEVHFKKQVHKEAGTVQVLQHISVVKGGAGKESSVAVAAGVDADLKEATKKKGEAEDYADVKENVGEKMVRYAYKHTEGYCFLYKNDSADYQLLETLEFEMKNLHIAGEDAKTTQIKVSVEPGKESFVELRTIVPKKGFSLEVSSATRIKKSKTKW